MGQPPEKPPFEYSRPQRETIIINYEIEKLLSKGVISMCTIQKGDYFSNLFTAPKKDGTYRTILNLKFLNKECNTHHFKMESLKQAIHMVKPYSYLASIDIKDAFYSVPIYGAHKRYLQFMWVGIAYQFNAMPNGYVDAMRVFTKLLKPVFSELREQGYISVVYVDDSLLYGDTYQECMENIIVTLECLQELGFIVHPTKSVLIPTQYITFLGFIFNTVEMTLTLTTDKKEKRKKLAIGLLTKKINIRMVASFVGNLTASFEAVPNGRLYYRHIETCKIDSLKLCKGNFEGPCHITMKAKDEIQWWVNNIEGAVSHIKSTPVEDYIIFTDASNAGWGASDTTQEINGRWSFEEQEMHINCLELLAVKLAISSLLPLHPNVKHVRIMSDNSTAISYINKQGGTHCLLLNDIAGEIWQMCIEFQVHISAAHIPGKHNILADTASREFHDSAEWMLPHTLFQNIIRAYGTPEIDLFASRLNKQLQVYASWKPDPDSTHIDAMSISWSGKFIYIFPPFSMIWPVLTKLEKDRVEKAIIIIPKWSTQSWYPRIMKKVLADPIMIESSMLVLPGTTKVHPLAPKLKMVAMFCSWRETQMSNSRRLPRR